VHWIIYNIPADVTELSEGIEREAQSKRVAGALQGRNSWSQDNVGYRGPMPPPGSGAHRYYFKLYALDCELNLDSDHATKDRLLSMMEGHILAQGELMGTYERR
jgi:Raf kinase inhibitor-like YbhB/YbcL family protein